MRLWSLRSYTGSRPPMFRIDYDRMVGYCMITGRLRCKNWTLEKDKVWAALAITQLHQISACLPGLRQFQNKRLHINVKLLYKQQAAVQATSMSGACQR